jgi:hypothetical protein
MTREGAGGETEGEERGTLDKNAWPPQEEWWGDSSGFGKGGQRLRVKIS